MDTTERSIQIENAIVGLAGKGVGDPGHPSGGLSHREIFTRAVGEHLDRVVGLLKEAAVVRPTGVRRPRTVERETWERLERAAAEVGLTPSHLLVACVRLAARRADADDRRSRRCPAPQK